MSLRVLLLSETRQSHILFTRCATVRRGGPHEELRSAVTPLFCHSSASWNDKAREHKSAAAEWVTEMFVRGVSAPHIISVNSLSSYGPYKNPPVGWATGT